MRRATRRKKVFFFFSLSFRIVIVVRFPLDRYKRLRWNKYLYVDVRERIPGQWSRNIREIFENTATGFEGGPSIGRIAHVVQRRTQPGDVVKARSIAPYRNLESRGNVAGVACELVDSHATLKATCLHSYVNNSAWISRSRVIVRRLVAPSTRKAEMQQLNSHLNEKWESCGQGPEAGPRDVVQVYPLATLRERERETTFTYPSYAFSFRLIIRRSLELKGNNVVVVFPPLSLDRRYDIPRRGKRISQQSRMLARVRRDMRKVIIGDYYYTSVFFAARDVKIKVLRVRLLGEKKKTCNQSAAPFLVPFVAEEGNRISTLKTWSQSLLIDRSWLSQQRTRNEPTVRLIDPLRNCALFTRARIEKSSRVMIFYRKWKHSATIFNLTIREREKIVRSDCH